MAWGGKVRCSRRGQVAFEEEGEAENHPLVTFATRASCEVLLWGGRPWPNLCRAGRG